MAEPLIIVCPICGESNEAARERCAGCGRLLRTASTATASSQQPTAKSTPSYLKYALIGAAVIAFLGVLGAPTDLICERTALSAPVNCTQTTRLLWFIPMSARQINGVRAAQVGEGGGDYGPTYRVEILTAAGMVPLMNGYTSGPFAKRQLADEINGLVASTGPRRIMVTEPGLLSSENIACSAIWVLGLVLWGMIKKFFGRSATTA